MARRRRRPDGRTDLQCAGRLRFARFAQTAGRRSRRGLGDVAKDFGYKGNWNYRLNSTEKTALRFKRAQLEDCLHILQRLDTDLKSSKLDADLLMQKALCELALTGRA